MESISVIVPVYNAEEYLAECVDSLLQQTYEAIEIILVDDGSVDSSGKMCDNYTEKDSRVQVYHIENSGPSFARNYGLKKSSGKYVMFVDSDDWIENTTLEICYKLQQEYQSDVVLFNLCDFAGESEKEHILFQKKIRVFERDQVQYLQDVMLSCKAENTEASTVALGGSACKMYRRSLVQECRFPVELSFGEDTCFMAQVLEKVNKVVYINETFYHRRVLTTSLQHSVGINQLKRRRKYVKWLTNFYKDKQRDIINQFIFHHYYMCILALKDSEELSVKDKVRLVKKFLHGLDYNFKEIEIACESMKSKVLIELAKREKIYPIYILLLLANIARR